MKHLPLAITGLVITVAVCVFSSCEKTGGLTVVSEEGKDRQKEATQKQKAAMEAFHAKAVDAVQIEVNGVGKGGIPYMEDWPRLPDGLPIRVTIEDIPRPTTVKKMAVRFTPGGSWVNPGEVGSVKIVFGSKCMVGVWTGSKRDEFFGAPPALIAIDSFEQTDAILDWSMTLDRRNEENTIIGLSLNLIPDIEERIVFGELNCLGMQIHALTICAKEPAWENVGMRPWYRQPGFTNQPQDALVPKTKVLAQDITRGRKHVAMTCRYQIATRRDTPVGILELFGAYPFDPTKEPSSREEQDERDVLVRLTVPITNYTDPILLFTKDNPSGVPITPEELKELLPSETPAEHVALEPAP